MTVTGTFVSGAPPETMSRLPGARVETARALRSRHQITVVLSLVIKRARRSQRARVEGFDDEIVAERQAPRTSAQAAFSPARRFWRAPISR